MKISTAILLVILAMPNNAIGSESCEFDGKLIEAGDIGVFADASGTEITLAVGGFMPFNIYVLAFSPPSGLAQAEFRLLIPEEFNVLNVFLPFGATNEADTDSQDYLIRLAACHWGPSVHLLTVNMGYFQGPTVPNDVPLCVRATETSPVAGIPVYEDCNGGTQAFGSVPDDCGRYPESCLILNATSEACPVESESFGTVKGRFRRS